MYYHYLLTFSLCCIVVYSAPVPEPWYGDFIGSLSDPQGIGIKGDVYLVNKSSIQVVGFSYGAQAPDLFFWADQRPLLTSTGVKIPTFEYGRKPLGKYEGKKVTVLNLPHDHKISDFKSFGLWCQAFAKSFGQVEFTEGHQPPKHDFLNGTLVGKKYKVGSGPILVLDKRTIKIFGFRFDGVNAPDGYFFVGTGPEPHADKGVKVPIRGRDRPDFITAMNEKYTGGKDLILDLPESHDIYNIDWISVFCYQFRIDFGHVLLGNVSDRIPPYVPPQKRYDDAMPKQRKPSWPVIKLLGNSARTNFTFQLGPPGGRRAYESWAEARPNEYVWYINGYMTPELILKRGVTYTFNVEGGDDPSTEHYYNPLYFSDELFGGYMKLPAEDREKVRIFAGLDGEGQPLRGKDHKTSGRLCLWYQEYAEENADLHDNFDSYRKVLKLKCSPGKTATFKWTPDSSTPDDVYYQSYTGYNMGWKMKIENQLPSDVADFTEQPYQYEIWLENNVVAEVPKQWRNSASLPSSWTLIWFLFALGLLSFR